MNRIEQFVQDTGFGLRSLLKTPSILLIAVLSAALGIGATSAIFSVIYGVVLEPFPYADVDSLMSIKIWDPGGRGYRTYYSTDQFLEFADRSAIFDGVIASTISDILWTGIPEPQRLRGNYITEGTFQVMGVPPLHGRAAEAADFRPDAPPIAVLGYRFWQRQFGGDQGVIGSELFLNGKVRTVIGVMPKRFMWRGADVYLPIIYERGKAVEGVRFVHVLGRLKPGVTESQAEVDLKPIVADLKAQDPKAFPDKWRVGLLSFKETFPSGLRRELWILFGAVGLLLLISCANVSNLLLTRAVARRREIAVRAALGAGRERIVRQLLTEGLIVAIAGGGLGILLAQFGLKAILILIPPGTLPDESEVVINLPVLLFALGISVAASLVFGLAPALHSTSGDLASVLKDSSRGVSGVKREAVVRNVTVVGSIALSLLLLVGASLMIRTVFELERITLPYDASNILGMRIPLPENQYGGAERKIAFFDELLRRVEALPGVRAVGLNTGMHPFGNNSTSVEVVGNTQADTRRVLIHQVNKGYFAAFGIPLRQGHNFTDSEIAGRRNLGLVNEAFVRRYSNDQSAIGRIVRVPPVAGLANDSFEIIGVVGNTLNQNFGTEIWPEAFLPYTILGESDRLFVRADARAAALAGGIRAEVLAIDRNQPVTDVKTMDALLKDWVFSGPRFNFVLFLVFSVVGLTLATAGVYGVISNSVSRQTREFGVRIALGATFADIASMVMIRGIALLAGGIVLGLICSLLAVRLVGNQIANLPKYDWLSFAGTSLLLLVVGLFACYWPARKASRVDPVVALRCE
jgi:predicted permease